MTAEERREKEIAEILEGSKDLAHRCIALNAYEAGRSSMQEEAAQVAVAHGTTIGDNCWNHENNRQEAPSTCWREIAAAIRAIKP